MSVDCVNGHGLNEVRAIWLFPNRDDDEFSKIKIWRCADKFRDESERWGIVFHDAGDGGVSDDFKLFVMSNRTNEFRGCLEYEEVGANFDESGGFVYVCGSELWYGGEDGEGGFRVEPMCGEECLE